MTFVVTQNTKS